MGPAPGERVELVFEGLDCLGTVWVNDRPVGRTDNMFIAHAFDITEALAPAGSGPNTLSVRIDPAVIEGRKYLNGVLVTRHDSGAEGVNLRKAPHMYGWDIMPRAVSAGIWRPVSLQPRRPTDFVSLYYWTADVRPDGATLGAHIQFRTDAATLDGFSVAFQGVCGDHTFAYEWPVEFSADHCRIPVPGAVDGSLLC